MLPEFFIAPPCKSLGRYPNHIMSPSGKQAGTSSLHHCDIFFDESRSTALNETQFPFLRLPPEIRNQIYRLLLVTKHVVKRRANSAHHSRLAESEPMLHPVLPQHLETGEVRSHSHWEYTLKFDLSILRVNCQIHEEASGIFQGENSWVIVCANKNRFGQDLKDHGYGVVYCESAGAARSIHRMVQHPVMKLSIVFAGSYTPEVKDTFIMTTAGISQLPRALWTLQDSHLVKLFYDSSPDFARYPAAAKKVVRAFSQLWRPSIEHFKVPKDHRGSDGGILLPNALHELDPIELAVPAQLKRAHHVIRDYCRERRFTKAALHGEIALAFVADCYKVYGQRMHYSFQGVRSMAETIVWIVMSLAEIEFALKNFTAVDRYCSYTLRMTNLHFLPRPVLVVRLRDRDIARTLLLRGQSRVKLGERITGMHDFCSAERLMAGDAGFRQDVRALVTKYWAHAPAELQLLRNLRIGEGTVHGMGQGKEDEGTMAEG